MSHDKHVRYDWSIRDGVISTSLVVMGLDAVQINQGHDVISPDAVWTGLRQRPGCPGRPGRRERTSTKRERNDRAHDTSRDVKSHVMRKEKKTSARPGATVSTHDRGAGLLVFEFVGWALALGTSPVLRTGDKTLFRIVSDIGSQNGEHHSNTSIAARNLDTFCPCSYKWLQN